MSITTQETTILPKHVLYIEDDQAEIYLMQRAINIQKLPFILDIARSMAEAVDKFNPAKHVLTVTDYNLPDAEAPEIAVALLAKHPDATIVALSNSYTDARIAQANAAGIRKCLIKSKPAANLEQITALVPSV